LAERKGSYCLIYIVDLLHFRSKNNSITGGTLDKEVCGSRESFVIKILITFMNVKMLIASFFITLLSAME
jgi:hypothetical protein